MASKRGCVVLILGFTLLAVPSQHALAGALTPEACGQLMGEIKALEATGLRSLMTRGAPETVVAGLSVVERQRLRRLLDAEAQMRFRCPQDQPLIALRQETAEEMQDQVLPGDEEGTAPPAASKADPGAAPQKKVLPKALPKAKTVATDPVETPQAPAKAQPQAQPARPAPRPKVDDAFRPAPGSTPGSAGGAMVPPVLPDAGR